MKVLFVCSGNLCRSPMAAAYLRQLGPRRGLSHLVVDSAGTLGIEGQPATPEAIEVLAEIGVDLTGHRSRGLRPADLDTSDYVVVMTEQHLQELSAYPRHGSCRRLLLRAFEHGPQPRSEPPDLDDPIGGSIDYYRQQRDLVMRCVDQLLLHLKHEP